MKITQHNDLEPFLAFVTPYLLQDEAQNNLLLGICHSLRNGKTTHKLLLTIEEAQSVVGVALQTEGHGLVLSPMQKVYAEALVQALKGHSFPSFIGEKQTCEVVVYQWQRMTNELFFLSMDQGVYALEQVIAPPKINGELLEASAQISEVQDTVLDWFDQFVLEAMPAEYNQKLIREMAARRLRSKDFHLWMIEGKPVSMAGLSGPTPNGIRVNAVYTPKALRGNGYASQVVAALSAHAISQGKKYCFLYTDLSNPTSNSIYQKIGYQRVGDSAHYAIKKD